MRRNPIVGAVLIASGGSLLSQLPVLAADRAAPAVTHAAAPAILANPSVDFALLLVALVALGLEVVHRGTFVFGVVGLGAGALAVIGLLSQPVDWAGLVLIGIAAGLLALDTQLHSHGLVSVAAVACAVLGGIFLYGSGPGVSLVAVVAVPVVVGALWITMSRRALRVRHLPFGPTNRELLGLTAVVRERAAPIGKATVQGELWRIESLHGEPIEVGRPVEVLAKDGLTLLVEELPDPLAVLAEASKLDSGAGTDQARRAS